MNTINFKGANDVIGRPKGTSAEECNVAIVHRGISTDFQPKENWPVITICWQFTPEEMEELLKNGGKIYQMIYSKNLNVQSFTPYDPIGQGWVRDSPLHEPINPERGYIENLGNPKE